MILMMPWFIVTAHSFLYINADPEVVFNKNYSYEEFKFICDHTGNRVVQTGVAYFSRERRNSLSLKTETGGWSCSRLDISPEWRTIWVGHLELHHTCGASNSV